MTRTFVCFTSALRSDAAQCISHETLDGELTICGRDVATAETVEADSDDREPDCLVCGCPRRKSSRRRAKRK